MSEPQKWAVSLGATGAVLLVVVAGVFLWPVAVLIAMFAGAVVIGAWGFKAMVLE